jgi:predicted component of type VI protein secretion system
MANLTVYFKNNIVCSYSLPFELGKVRIGRDKTNDVVIDSPEFAPVHALIMVRSNNALVRQLNEDFPLVVNGKNTKEANLNDGDTLTVGRHIIVYSTSELTKSAKNTDIPTNQQTTENYISHAANYQIISGTHIGKIFHLKPPMTMIGEPGTGIVVISKRKDGYFVSVLENIGVITLNKQPLADSMVKLNHHDVLVVGNMTIEFYLR